ncbi:hypothetical protein L1276_001782 [Flavobacterium sp. HSC-32F16]|uniref:T9SS type A sorting domain-containing protein n=1 Tax=Flavobacterium sp. HSC-32F16 TaxID=2910964 RepID=UPI0020A364E2|nr:T9SS type A sorting domain-containing protein [Flavobacterium sp. HSC-32F16]MCP2026638.1 hypothetical protein [Flavobacterium sp. HSC-32F16]
MKKTLLCFLFLLFYNLFYSQAGDLVNCSGITTFNLHNSRSLLLGSVNQVPAVITYYESLENATDKVNVIETPAQYVSTVPSKTIYARIEYNGVVTTNYFNLIVGDPLTATLETNMVTCAREKNGSIIINTSGGKAPFTYKLNWQIVQNTNVFNNLPGGYYSIIVTDALGCETTVNTIITEPVMLETNFHIQNQTITAYTTGGTLPYQYSLDGVNFQSNNFFNNVSPGNHLLWVRDANGCVIQKTVTIATTSPIITAVTTTSINCNNPTAVITVTAAGGQAPYTYSIDNGVTYRVSNIFSNIFPGIYYIKVKDVNNDEATSVIYIDPAPVLTAAANLTKKIDCNSYASINVTATGGTAPFQYSINDSPFQNSNVFSNLTSGIYHIKVKDSQNCTFVTNQIVIDPLIPLSATINQNVDCSSSSITVNASGGISPYVYSFDNGTTYQSSNIFSLLPGVHNVIVKDANNCEFTRQFISESPLPLTITSSLVENEDCDRNKTLTVKVIGGVAPYTYSIGNGYQRNDTFYNVLAGNYIVSVQDSQGCIKNIPLTVTPPNVLISTISVNNVICNGSATGAITVNASGGFSPYSYSLNGGAFVNSSVFNNLQAGLYTITVQDAIGCMRPHYVNISEPNSLAMNIEVIAETLDENIGTKITIVSTGGTGPYTYNIKNNVTGEIVAENKKITSWSGFRPGSYTFTVIDSKGCTFENNNVNIVIQSPILLNAVRTPITCTNNFASLSINPSGGVPPYLYSYDRGATYTTSNTGLNNLNTGLYTILVKDAASSEAQANIFVKAYNPVTTAASTNINCYGANDGTITVTASGGIAPYTYSIGNEYKTSNVFNNLSVGDYILKVKDAAGCITTTNAKIIQPDFISYKIAITNSTTINSYDGKIVITPSGGTAPYLYSLQNQNGGTLIPFQPSNNLANLPIGTYTVVIKDAKDCLKTITRINLSSTIVSATAVVTPITCVTLGTITVNTVGGKLPFVYSFSGNNYGISNVAKNLPAGNYTIKIKDSQNNITTIYATIPPLNTVIINASLISEIDCNGNNNAVIRAIATGGKAPYTYKLNDGSYQTSNIFSNLSPGTYQIGVKDSGQCISTQVITITEPRILASTVEITDDKIIVFATGGTAPYTYELENQTGISTAIQTSNVFNDVPSGTYLVKVKDAKNCRVTYNSITISETTPPDTTDKMSHKAQAKGIENKNLLEVNTADFTAFKFYPNPVQNILTVNNTSIIDEVQILSASGNSILIKKVNHTQTEIDFSNLSTGIYILKITSKGKEKTTKIIKK